MYLQYVEAIGQIHKFFVHLKLKGTLGLENKEIGECVFFWDYYILGWGEPIAKIFGLLVN